MIFEEVHHDACFFCFVFFGGGGGSHNPGKEVRHFFKFAISQLHFDSQIDLVLNPAKQLNFTKQQILQIAE